MNNIATSKPPFTFPQNEFFKELEELTLRYFENGLPVVEIVTALRLHGNTVQELEPPASLDEAIEERMADARRTAAASPKFACRGCGSTETIEEIRARFPHAIACCPERNMNAIIDARESAPVTPSCRAVDYRGIAYAAIKRMKAAGESHEMCARWISEDINRALAQPYCWGLRAPNFLGSIPEPFGNTNKNNAKSSTKKPNGAVKRSATS